jgi:hypothetical protein
VQEVKITEEIPEVEDKSDNLADAIAKAISGKVDAGLNKKDIEKLIDAKLKNIAPSVKQIEVKSLNGDIKKVGIQHKIFEKVLKVVSQRINISLVGAAGSGKTTLVENIATAIDLPFYTLSVGLQTTKTDLIGYMDATGNYIRTALRNAFEFGGVFLLDELDAGNAGVLTLINSMTSNGVASFPDGMIEKHEDFIMVAASNTYGRGADRLYVGRNQLDAATLDRFIVINMDYDEDLELAISPDENWTKYVQSIRGAVFKLRERIVVSPRASINGGKLLEVGFNEDEVAKMVIWKGIDAGIKEKVINFVEDRREL